jgi:hypothetical protein
VQVAVADASFQAAVLAAVRPAEARRETSSEWSAVSGEKRLSNESELIPTHHNGLAF